MQCRIGRLPYRKWCTHTPPSRHPPERDHSTAADGRTLKLGVRLKAGRTARLQIQMAGVRNGQSPQFGDVRATSALPPKTDIYRKGRHVSKVPGAELA